MALSCSSRKGTVDTAMHLVSVVNKGGRGYIRDRNHHDKMQRLAATSSNKQLQQTLPAGIAFHNAGMDATERAQVEELFIARDVLVMRLSAAYSHEDPAVACIDSIQSGRDMSQVTVKDLTPMTPSHPSPAPPAYPALGESTVCASSIAWGGQ